MQIRDIFGETFFVLLDVVRTVFGDDYSTKAPPSMVTASLLDPLFIAMQKHLVRGERIVAGVVMRVFTRSAESLWGMVGRWLKEGMGIGDVNDLDDEFFIESNGLGSGAFGVGHTLRQRDVPSALGMLTAARILKSLLSTPSERMSDCRL